MMRVYVAPHHTTSVKTQMPLSFVYAMPQLVRLLEGYGDVMAYGFASETDDGNLVSWVVGDLRIFREWFCRQLYQGQDPKRLPGMVQSNHDGSADFVGFYLDKLPSGVVMARQRWQGGEPSPVELRRGQQW